MILKKILQNATIIVALNSGAVQADDTSFGLGLGAPYNGIGANVSWTNENSMKYVALGCAKISGSSDDVNCDFGIGFGYINTSLFSIENNNHGIGVNAGISRRKYFGYAEDKEITLNEHYEEVYTLGIDYTYFFEGIDNAGWNVGLSPHVEFVDSETNFGIYLGLGYQF